MARTWLSISVELLGGRGEELWPFPGRIFAVGPSHTFADFADAINTAFARWDRAHLSQFNLADGSVMTEFQYLDELPSSLHGPLVLSFDANTTKVSRTVKPGDVFQFVFDLGDFWVHRCTVEAQKVDPLTVLGIRPETPLAHWGWGNIPDQYGRRWESDDTESPLPRRPTQSDSMVSRAWPPPEQLRAADLEEIRSAVDDGDDVRFLTAITGVNIDEVLEEVASHAPMLLDARTEPREAIVLSLVHRLHWRNLPGDSELADQLVAQLRAD